MPAKHFPITRVSDEVSWYFIYQMVFIAAMERIISYKKNKTSALHQIGVSYTVKNNEAVYNTAFG